LEKAAIELRLFSQNFSGFLIEFVEGIRYEPLRRCSDLKAMPAKMQNSGVRILGSQPSGRVPLRERPDSVPDSAWSLSPGAGMFARPTIGGVTTVVRGCCGIDRRVGGSAMVKL
jgi:hypothetical protein